MVSAKLVAMTAVLGACMGAIVVWYEGGNHHDSISQVDDEAGAAAYAEGQGYNIEGFSCASLKEGGELNCDSELKQFCAQTCAVLGPYSLTTLATIKTDMELDVEMYYTNAFGTTQDTLTLTAVQHDSKTYLSAQEAGYVFRYDTASGELEECKKVTGDLSFISDYASMLDTDDLNPDGSGTIVLPADAGSLDIHSVVSGVAPADGEFPTLMGVTIPKGEDCEKASTSRRMLQEAEAFDEQTKENDEKRELQSNNGYGISDLDMWKMSVCSNPGGMFCKGNRMYPGSNCQRVHRIHDDPMSAAAQLWQCGAYKVVAWEETGMGNSAMEFFYGIWQGLKDAQTDFDVASVSCGNAGYTHRGFCNYVTSLEARIAALGWGPHPNTYVTGWSLGGSAATVHKARNPGYGGLVSFGALKTSGNGACRQSGTRYTMGVDPAQSNWGTYIPFYGHLNTFHHLNHDINNAREVYNNQYCNSYVHWVACSGCSGCSGCGWGGCSGCSGCSGCWSYNSGSCHLWGWVDRWEVRNVGCTHTDDSEVGNVVSAALGIFDNHPNYDRAAF